MTSELKSIFEKRFCDDLLTRTAWASAACFYRYIPKAVVFPKNADEIAKLFAYATQHNENLTFRAAGTSLSGQSVTDGFLVDCGRHWRQTKIGADGVDIWFEAGVVAKQLNNLLQPYGRKIGPDPASIDSCRMGGVLANNASGMCCGVAHNSYHTLKNIQFILADGKRYDTREQNDFERFEDEQKNLYKTLINLRTQVLENDSLKTRIQHKFKIKNTMGYALNALIDFSHPLDIFAHLLVGSEGTLAFIESATLKSVPTYPHAATALLYFYDIDEACAAIPFIKLLKPVALELMDNVCLKAIEHSPLVPLEIKQLPAGSTALLVEWGAQSLQEQNALVQTILSKTLQINLRYPFQSAKHSSSEDVFSQLTTNPAEQQILWNVRKGIFPSVGAKRQAGATVVIEDVCVPTEHLAAATKQLRLLLNEHKYLDSAIFGHANDGNLHFVMNVLLNNPQAIALYESFMTKVSDLIVGRFDGSLKAEHGTGRNMAPFVEHEWGHEAYEIMRQIKKSADPNAILNRDVLLSDNPKIHISNIKDFPKTNSIIDACIECGFCETKCPSNGFTLSPRQRIVAARELSRCNRDNRKREAKELFASFHFSGIETCATDGLCATTCPVAIDTGRYIKTLRRDLNTKFQTTIAGLAARYFRLLTYLIRSFGPLVRLFLPNAPRFRGKLLSLPVQNPNVSSSYIYFPSCIVRTFAEPDADLQISADEAFLSLCHQAKVQMPILEGSKQLCCGMPFESKGFALAQEFKENELLQALQPYLNLGSTIRLVTDTSTCSYRLKQLVVKKKLNVIILDVSEFLRDEILPKISVVKKLSKIALHPGCGAIKASLLPAIKTVAEMCAQEVYISPRAACCGSAGDKGIRIPLLVANALSEQARDIAASKSDKCFGTNLICQTSLTHHTNQKFLSLVHLVHEATRP